MRRLLVVVAVLTWAVVRLVSGGNPAEDGGPRPVCGDPDAGDCFVANGTPGCSDAACCELRCSQAPYCCEVGWDATCANNALIQCNLCDCTQDGECGDGRACVDGTCAPIPTGACCQCNETERFCTELTAAECEVAGGTYLGDRAGCDGGRLVIESCIDEIIFSTASTIRVKESFTIHDLEVNVLISHTWVGELCVALSKENGPTVLLVERMGFDGGCSDGCCGCSSDHLNITLSDDETADSSIDGQCGWNPPALTGVFVPKEPLSVFDGIDAAGEWTLMVKDRMASADVGDLHRWGLRLAMPPPAQPPCSLVACACPWDLDDSGSVDIADLFGLLARGDADPAGPPDFDGDGEVGIADFLLLLANWGPCQ